MSDNSPATPKLNACQGEPAPELMVEGWKCYVALPAEGKGPFWNLAAPTLLDLDAQRTPELIQGFCSRFETNPDDVTTAVRGCTLFLGRASALDITAQQFQADLDALSGGSLDDVGPILEQYEATKRDIREAMIRGSLSDHGKVLTGVDWRVDQMTASDRGTRFDTNVVFLTLRYQDGDKNEKITLQLTSEGLSQLKSFSDRFGGDAGAK
ncbi:MAG: hypothetical protein AAF517_24860 [Planctomycetota bacterium]